MLSDEMTNILQNPQDYAIRRVAEPGRANTGKIVPQLLYVEGVNPEDLAHEIGLTGNLQDFMIRINAGDNTVASTYVVSKNGFSISVDKVSDSSVDENNIPLKYDYTTRPWYQNAIREKKLTFTDLFVDLAGRGLAMSCSAPYYDMNGEIAGVVGEGRILNDLAEIVNQTKIGDTGHGFILDDKGQVLFSPKTEGTLSVDYNNNLEKGSILFNNDDTTLAETAKLMAKGETGIKLVNIDGKSYYLAYTPLERKGWSFGAVIEESEVTMSSEVNKHLIEKSTNQFVGILDNSIKMMILAMFAAFLAIFALVSFAGRSLADKFTKPIQLLTDGVREIASGNLDKKLDIHTGNEIEHLAVCFNAMTDELKTYMNNLTKITAENERIATELDVAKNIQISCYLIVFRHFMTKKNLIYMRR